MTAALVLAAGRGERLRPMTDTIPKPLVEVGDETLLDRHLRILAAAGVTRAVVNLGWLGEQIVEHVGDGARHGLRIVYSPEGYPPLDSGGAIRRALPLIGDEPFWVVNADIHVEYAFDDAPEALLAGRDAAIGLTPNPPWRDGGDFVIDDGLARNTGGPMQTFSGIACYRPGFVANAPDGRFSIVPLLRAAADRGALSAFDLPGAWHDVGTPERLAALRRVVENPIG